MVGILMIVITNIIIANVNGINNVNYILIINSYYQ